MLSYFVGKVYAGKRKIENMVIPFNHAIYKWVKCNGDLTYRIDYELTEASIVFDLGGYRGDFVQKIVDKYNCYVYVFEPVPKYAEQIVKRFAENDKVKVFCFGLDCENADEVLYMSDDGSSVYKKNDKEKINIKYVSASDFFSENAIVNIDLMKINIEGGEYSLLEHLLETGEISIIDNIQVQFHNIKAINAKKRMHRIWKKLKITHILTWHFRPFVWENWKRK